MLNLKIGDANIEGTVKILDEDRLCYRVLSTSKSSYGIRTISKTLLEEFVDYERNHPNSSSQKARDELSGKTTVDKFEYGYCATLWSLAKLNKSLSSREATQSIDVPSDSPLQQIFYGAPGTGKSFEINRLTEGKAVVRTTFHPDSDYSTFVGAYKPVAEEAEARVVPVVVATGITLEQNQGTYREKRITYKFVKQAFLKAYLGAWKKYADAGEGEAKHQYLVIEEINRGNCAQIFGDIFQLLDRQDNGFSSYPIEADTDLQQEIKRAFDKEEEYLIDNLDVKKAVEKYTSNYGMNLSDDIRCGRVLLLPPNLYIWATMNTSDQSLFPIDSAFKRRWDWKYMPIDTEKESWSIDIDGNSYSWSSFLEKINKEIFDATSSEDKQLGFYFCKAQSGVIPAEKFVGKVLFYIYNDVFKDYGFDRDFFKDKNNGDKLIAFRDFFKSSGDINEGLVAILLKNLGVAFDNAQDDKNELPKKSETLSVTFPDGHIIKEEKTLETYVNVIKEIGSERVALSGINRNSDPLVKKGDDYGDRVCRQDGDYYILTAIRHPNRCKLLEKLNKALELNLDIKYTL